MPGEYPDRTEPWKATEQVEQLELDDEQRAAEPLDWPPEDPEYEDPEQDAEPVHGPNRAEGPSRVDAPEEEALHRESDRSQE